MNNFTDTDFFIQTIICYILCNIMDYPFYSTLTEDLREQVLQEKL